MTDYVIETEGLTKRYGERIVAVHDLALHVRRGEVYGFVGPNGAGKTTTLRMLLGLVRPTSGRATVLGHAAGSREALALVGAMIESPDFYPFLSGRDNLRVMALRAGAPAARIDDLLSTVGLSSRAGDRFSSYSTGMKQRLGVAAALLKDPDLLILDEPTNGLDPEGIVEMRALVRNLGRGDRTVLLSSHLMAEVEQICDRVGVISQGRLVAEESLDALRGRPQIRIDAVPLERARAVAQSLPGVEHIRIDDGRMVVTAGHEHAAAINERLVQAGVEVSTLEPGRTPLEEVFFDVVHGSREEARDD